MTEFYLEYGDLIHITSKTESLNDKQFRIKYIDEKHIRIDNKEGTRELQLEEDGSFSDLAIISVKKISSAPMKGFAFQNGLVIGKTIKIKFVQEDFPDMSGFISNLENDRIEIMLVTEEIIYIDFEYKGMPSFIKQIEIKNNPIVVIEPTLPEVGDIDILPEINEEIHHDPDHTDIIQEIRDEYNRAQQENNPSGQNNIQTGVITFGETRNIIVRTEKEEKFLSHSIEAQVTDIVDSLLSTIPNNQRTESVLAEVHHQVERYKQLRTTFSQIDEHGSIICPSTYSENNKPLATLITSGNSKIPKWILPVIAAERKTYSVGNKEDNGEDIEVSIGREYKEQSDYYKNSNVRDMPFVQYINNVNEYSIPYTDNEDTILHTQQINDDQETLLFDARAVTRDTDGNSNKYTLTDNITMIQKLRTGSKYTKNETQNIKSFVMLRDFMVEYSKINLNNSSIMTRSAMNKNHISFNPTINDKTVDKYEENNFTDNKNKQLCPKDRPRVKHMEEKELNEYRKTSYEEKIINVTKEGHVTENQIKKHFVNLKPRAEVDFLRSNANYMLNTDNVKLNTDSEKYAKFVYTIIPATTDLIKLSYIDSNKHITKNYSFHEFVNQFLEPFMIYSKNIHFNGGYHFIRAVIEDKIRNYIVKVKQHTDSVQKQISKLKKENVFISNKDAHIEKIINSKIDVFQKNYFGGLEVVTTTSSTERLSSMFNIDGTDMMSNIIFSKNLNLVIDPSFVEEIIDDEKPTDCPQKFIAKKYSSLDALKADNGVEELYYDVGQDDTPYEILQLYKKQENMEGNFKQFLQKQLIDKHSCPETAAADLATTLILGKKLVTLGEYALLNQGDEDTVFYKRISPNKWSLDRSTKKIEFVNNNELFCNINSKCIKNNKTKTCDSITEYKNVYVAEFKTRLDALDIKLKIQNENNIEKLSGFISRNNNLKYIQSHRQNLLSVKLAELATVDNTAKSQYIQLRDTILSHTNFPEKQTYLKRFAEKFTRTPFTNLEDEKDKESEHWLYCKETNTKLIPVFLIQLAIEYDTNGAEAYKTKLEDILSDCGDPDSDGAYYDKNSGYLISKMNYATTDDYTTHSIIEKEDTTIQKFNRNTSVIETVFYAICSNLGVLHKESVFREFVIRKTTEYIDSLGNEEKYLIRIKKMAKIGKTAPPSYELYINANIIYTLSALILISIQTAVEPIGKTKTFEECTRSFSGYPLTDETADNSGIKYLSCAIIKLKSPFAPWDAIKNSNDKIFNENLFNKIKILLKNDVSIKKLIDDKKIELEKPDGRTITETTTNNISKWVGVLPPIGKFTVHEKDLNHITEDFFADLKKNPQDNDNKIGVIKSKIILYGYAIIQSINDAIDTIIDSNPDNLLLGTSGDKSIPYTQNSCCNEINDQNNVLAYLSNRNPKVSQFIANSKKCEEVLSKLRQLNTPLIFCYNKDTSNRIKTDQFPKQHISNITQTFIHYLNFDNKKSIPFVFGDTYKKPSKYAPNMSFQDKIESFRKDNYDTTTFDNILKTVFSENMKSAVAIINDETTYDESVKFDRFITSMTQNVVPEDIVEGTAVDIMHKFSTTSLDEFKNYILTVNGKMIDDDSVFKRKLKGICEMSSWNIYKQDDSKIQSNSVFFNFVQNAIFNVSKLYPSFIINGITEHVENKKSWGLSTTHLDHLNTFNEKHLFKLITNYKEGYKDVFSGDLSELETIIQLSKNIPNSDKYDKDVTNLLLTYSWLSVFRIFIHSASQLNDDDREKDHYKNKMIKILKSFLEIETKNKGFLDISNKQVEDQLFKSRQIEKKRFTDLLKGMNSDGRKLMKEMKHIGLGIWREGKIGLVKYDKKAYDRDADLYSQDEDAELGIVNDDGFNEDPEVDEEEQSGYDNGDGDGNDDNDNDFDN